MRSIVLLFFAFLLMASTDSLATNAEVFKFETIRGFSTLPKKEQHRLKDKQAGRISIFAAEKKKAEPSTKKDDCTEGSCNPADGGGCNKGVCYTHGAICNTPKATCHGKGSSCHGGATCTGGEYKITTNAQFDGQAFSGTQVIPTGCVGKDSKSGKPSTCLGTKSFCDLGATCAEAAVGSTCTSGANCMGKNSVCYLGGICQGESSTCDEYYPKVAKKNKDKTICSGNNSTCNKNTTCTGKNTYCYDRSTCSGDGASCSDNSVCTKDGQNANCYGGSTCNGPNAFCTEKSTCTGPGAWCGCIGEKCATCTKTATGAHCGGKSLCEANSSPAEAQAGSNVQCSDQAKCTGTYATCSDNAHCTGAYSQCASSTAHCVIGSGTKKGSPPPSTTDNCTKGSCLGINGCSNGTCVSSWASCDGSAQCYGPNSTCIGDSTCEETATGATCGSCAAAKKSPSCTNVVKSGTNTDPTAYIVCLGKDTTCHSKYALCCDGATCTNPNAISVPEEPTLIALPRKKQEAKQNELIKERTQKRKRWLTVFDSRKKKAAWRQDDAVQTYKQEASKRSAAKKK